MDECYREDFIKYGERHRVDSRWVKVIERVIKYGERHRVHRRWMNVIEKIL